MLLLNFRILIFNFFEKTILIGNYDNDEAVIELKAALWAMGHFSTSSMGAKYLQSHDVIKAIVALAETCTVYAVKMTAVYVLSLIATSNEGVAVLNSTSMKSICMFYHGEWDSTDFTLYFRRFTY